MKTIIKDTETIMGLGVYSKSSIAKGELIERVPFIEVQGEQVYTNLDFSPLKKYLFYIPETVMPTGILPWLNHSDNPNCRIEFDRLKDKFLRLYSLRYIRGGEQLFIEYPSKEKNFI